MKPASFVAGDWGTTNLRLFLCDAGGTVLDSRSGPGAAEVHGDILGVFESLIAPWEALHGSLPAILCGMVGSNIGWTVVPYVACPAVADTIAAGCVAVRDGRVHIAPGLECINRFNAPDFMRGEETQILGAMQLVESLRQGRQLLCLPGTHTKWVVLEEGAVTGFFTALTGELFALLRDHSILLRSRSAPSAASDDADTARAGAAGFAAGIAHVNEFPGAQVLHRVFECRSRQLSGELQKPEAMAYLSGLLVASDVRGALDAWCAPQVRTTVYLVGSSAVLEPYALAVSSLGHEARCLDGAAAARSGLRQLGSYLSHPSIGAAV